jgi:drug/metabolite transporter (DMT)-like permease
MMNKILPWFWLVFGIFMIWNYWKERRWHIRPTPTQRQIGLIIAGVMLGWASWMLLNAYISR